MARFPDGAGQRICSLAFLEYCKNDLSKSQMYNNYSIIKGGDWEDIERETVLERDFHETMLLQAFVLELLLMYLQQILLSWGNCKDYILLFWTDVLII